MSGYRHILAAIDFSAGARKAARRAAELAGCFGAELTLLHVIDYFPEDTPVNQISPENEDPAKFLMARSLELLADIIEKDNCKGARHKVLFSNHSAAYAVVDFSQQEAVDLIVVGSHGQHGISDILGSTAGSIAHRAGCDLLVVRQDGPE